MADLLGDFEQNKPKRKVQVSMLRSAYFASLNAFAWLANCACQLRHVDMADWWGPQADGADAQCERNLGSQSCQVIARQICRKLPQLLLLLVARKPSHVCFTGIG